MLKERYNKIKNVDAYVIYNKFSKQIVNACHGTDQIIFERKYDADWVLNNTKSYVDMNKNTELIDFYNDCEVVELRKVMVK